MRTVYVATLFVFIFNSMLVLFGFFFSNSLPVEAVNITANETAKGYALTGGIDFITGENSILLGISAVGIGLGGIGSWLTKSTIPIGIGVFGAVIGIFHTFGMVIYNIDPTHNWMILAIIDLLAICLGLLVAYDVVEMLTQQRGST